MTAIPEDGEQGSVPSSGSQAESELAKPDAKIEIDEITAIQDSIGRFASQATHPDDWTAVINATFLVALATLMLT